MMRKVCNIINRKGPEGRVGQEITTFLKQSNEIQDDLFHFVSGNSTNTFMNINE